MDECDLGSKASADFLSRAVAHARSRRPAGISRTECIDCGENIPEGRRKAVPGCVRCVQCETELEHSHGS